MNDDLPGIFMSRTNGSDMFAYSLIGVFSNVAVRNS